MKWFYCFTFSISIETFFGFEQLLYWSFQKIRRKRNSMMGSIFCYAAGLRSWNVLLEIFCNFQTTKSVDQLNDCFWAFSYFWKTFQLLIFLGSSHLLPTLIWKYFFKYVNFIKTIILKDINFCGTDFLKFCELWSIPRKKKYSSNSLVAKSLMSRKKVFEIHLQKLVRDKLFEFKGTGFFNWNFSKYKK